MASWPHSAAGIFRLTSVFIMFVCGWGTVAPRCVGQTSAQPVEGQLAEGIKLLSAGRLLESVKALNAAKQSAPQDARPYFYCGMALAQAGQMRDAAAELAEAVHLAPDQLDYRVFQAHVFQQLMQTYAAENTLTVFKSDHALHQLDSAWLRLLGDVYYRLGKADETLRVLDRWAEREPNDARIDLGRGQVYVMKGEPEKALKSFEKSLQESNQNPQAYFELGKILYRRHELAAAKEALVNAVREDGNNPEYASKLASVYLALDDPDAAITTLTKVESAGPNFPTIYYDLGRAYRSKGDSVRSAEYSKKFEDVTSADRDRTAQREAADRPLGRAERLLEQGHSDEARALFEKSLEVDPNRWEPNAYLAEMDLDSGDLAGAYPHLQKLEQIDPDSAIGNFLMARYWFKQKEYEQARLYAEKVKLSRPGNSELRGLLGSIYLGLGQKEEARKEYEAAVRLAPGRADFREQLQKLLTASPAPDGGAQRP
jgi:tetratricopeptide (TPR) repeat protein